MLLGHRRVRLRGNPTAVLRSVILGARHLRHNGAAVTEYPEASWNFVPFPAQKGPPYAADNLATVNDHSFLLDPRFRAASEEALERWRLGTRDISWRLHTFLWAMETALRLHPQGALVELGTGHGFMAAGACRWLEWGGTTLTQRREFWLFDSFEPELPFESPASQPRRFYYADGDEEVRAYFRRFHGIRVVTGVLPKALDDLEATSVAFVHVDLNHATAEVESLDRLSGRLLPGAIILFDDSGNPGCRRQLDAHRDWAARRDAPFLQLPTGQGLIALPASAP